jgi:ppGpp synthetase/RelA/SpoT-type nucleotidyltranferase
MSDSVEELSLVNHVPEAIQEARARSPLWMVSQEPLLNDLVVYLTGVRERLLCNADHIQEIVFSRAHLRECRGAFDRMIRRGEESLHRLCELFCNSFFGQYQLQSVVIGEVPSNGERFTLTQLISRLDLYSTIDLDLGSRQLRKLQYFDGETWLVPSLVANVVEYQPTEPNSLNIHKVISRIKAEEELWNKVVDEIFGLDTLVERDKQLRHLSRYVKDIFGIKIVVGTPGEALALHATLEKLSFDQGRLEQVGMLDREDARELSFIETKNYLRQHEKGSGWEAMKSVVRWNGRMFEIQVQPLRNFWREREHLTRESHAGFKSRREQIRQQVSAQIPLFGFYQSLLKWLFQNPDGPAPDFAGISVVVRE